MKRNIMLIVVLGLALYGVVSVLGLWMSSDGDAVGYSTERMVEAAYRAHVPTTYTPSAAGNNAVAVPMSAGHGTPFRHTYVPAANYTISTPVLNGGSYALQGLMLTSHSRQQSYGGSAAGTSATRTSAGSSSLYAMGGHGSSASASGGYLSGGYSLGGIYSSGNTYSTPAGGGISVHGNMTSTFSPSVYASAPAPYASFNNDFGAVSGSYSVLDGAVMPLDSLVNVTGAFSEATARRMGITGPRREPGVITGGDKDKPTVPINMDRDAIVFVLSLAVVYVCRVYRKSQTKKG